MTRVDEIERAIESLTDEEFCHVAGHVQNLAEQRKSEIAHRVREGLEAIKRGEYEDHDETSTKLLAEGIKQRGRERLSRITPSRP